MFDHATIDKENNQPVKFRVGLTKPNRLLDMSKYFSGDTLSVFGEPLLKTEWKEVC